MTMEGMISQLGIEVDRTASTSLVDQVASGLQEAIQSGVLPAGKRLPGLRQIAEETGVSYVVANRAVQRLATSGFLAVRRKTGIHVLSPDERVWSGHALWVAPAAHSYFFAVRQDALMKRLVEENIRVSTLCLEREEEGGRMSVLRAALDTMSVTVVVCCQLLPGLFAECARRGIPVVSGADIETSAARGWQSTPADTAMRELAEHCVALGVKQPMGLALISEQEIEAESAFAAANLPLNTITDDDAWWNKDRNGLEALEGYGYDAVSHLITTDSLPELLYVGDDFVARGCMAALWQHQVRIPEKLQVVIRGNRGNLPVGGRSFTRIELDPAAVGHVLGDVVLEVLGQQKSVPVIKKVPAKFIVGETTRSIPSR